MKNESPLNETQLNALLSRRSIRKYSDRSIAESDIESIRKAAMYAPSAVNLRNNELPGDH